MMPGSAGGEPRPPEPLAPPEEEQAESLKDTPEPEQGKRSAGK